MQTSADLVSTASRAKAKRTKAAVDRTTETPVKAKRTKEVKAAVDRTTETPVKAKRIKAAVDSTTETPVKAKRTKEVKAAVDGATETPVKAKRTKEVKAAVDSTTETPVKAKRTKEVKAAVDGAAPVKAKRTKAAVGGDAPPRVRRTKTSVNTILTDPNVLTAATLAIAVTIPTIVADTTLNNISAVRVQLECSLFPAIKALVPQNVELKYVSAHYVQFTISNTSSTTCNFLRQQFMGAPTIRLYAAYSYTGDVDHSKLQLTCKYCPFWQYVVDNIKLIPIFQKVSLDSKFAIHVTNTTNAPLMVCSTDIVRLGGNMFPINKYPLCELSPGSELHIDNICPINNTSVVHAAHSNVAHVRVTNKKETDELVDDTGDFDISFKLLEGVLPTEFITTMFAAINARFTELYAYLDSGKDGIVLCRMQNNVYQYSVHFTEPLMFVQYLVRLAQDAKHTIGSTMNPDDVCVSMYTDDIIPVLKTSCQLAIQHMALIKTQLLAQMS